ncbi:hypothetical protein DFH27DRAFT_528008 [Peziza echinospora]|nr:hypothetical protein DFH27DRAFT_528008 [Peziza echinospora]
MRDLVQERSQAHCLQVLISPGLWFLSTFPEYEQSRPQNLLYAGLMLRGCGSYGVRPQVQCCELKAPMLQGRGPAIRRMQQASQSALQHSIWGSGASERPQSGPFISQTRSTDQDIHVRSMAARLRDPKLTPRWAAADNSQTKLPWEPIGDTSLYVQGHEVFLVRLEMEKDVLTPLLHLTGQARCSLIRKEEHLVPLVASHQSSQAKQNFMLRKLLVLGHGSHHALRECTQASEEKPENVGGG